MERVEARIWNYPTETFQNYALDKLMLMKGLKLPDKNVIAMLIKGIKSISIKSSAALIKANSVDDFLKEMCHLTMICAETNKKAGFNDTKHEKKEGLSKEKTKDNSSPTEKT